MQQPIASRRPLIALMIAVTIFLVMSPAVLRGSVVFYSTRSSFNTAEPGLPVEGFSNANIATGSILVQASPLSSATNNSIFSTGGIMPGLTISNSNPANTPGLIVYGDGAIFGGTKSVGNNWFGDSLILSFAPGVSAIGADVFAATSPGQTLAGVFTEDVYDGTTLLGSTTFSEAKGAFGFIGVSSTSPITSVALLYTTDDATTFVDDIAFGAQAASATPEPSTFILSAIPAVLFGIRAAVRRRAGRQ